METVERIFSVADHPSLHVSNIRGSIRVVTGDTHTINLSATVADDGIAGDTTLEFEQSNDTAVRVTTRFERNGWAISTRPARVDFLLMVPANCDLSLHTVAGDATIAGVAGRHDYDTVSGNLYANDLQGTLKVKTVSGDVKFGACLFDSIRLHSVSGDAAIATPLASDGRYAFKSVSGDITLTVPDDSAYRLELRAVRRRISRGSNGAVVSLRTVSGDLHIRNHAGAPVTTGGAAAPPHPQQAGTTTREILRQIERGDLSVEDALGQLGY